MDDFNPNENKNNNFDENNNPNQQGKNQNEPYYYSSPNFNSTDNRNYYQPNSSNFSNNSFDTNLDETKKTKSKKSVVTIAIVLIVCIIIAVVGIFATTLGIFSVNTNQEGNTNNTQNSVQADVEKSDSNASKDKNGNLTTVGVVEKAIDSCVGITVYSSQSYNDIYSYGFDNSQGGNNSNKEKQSGEGSGVLMLEDSNKGLTYILTCAHVISDGSKFVVTLNDNKEYDATLVGYDSQTDIGVLSIKETGLSVATFGDSNDIQVGEDCIAIGNPGGLTYANSVTKGIVSALERPVSSSIGYDTDCIQTDAAINPGNSGGALFNMQGQVIGINSSKIASTEYEGMGFAIPSTTAIEIANSLISNGYVTGRAQIGIQYQPLSTYLSYNQSTYSNILSALEDKGFKKCEGAIRIAEINSDSDLSGKDVKQNDIIVAVDGDTMTSVDILTSCLSSKKPGDTVTLSIARIENNKLTIKEVKCKLGEQKAN